MDDEIKSPIYVVIVLIGLLLITLHFDALCSDTANDICIEKGFDQYKRYSVSPFNPLTPIGIKCEYAPQSIYTINQK